MIFPGTQSGNSLGEIRSLDLPFFFWHLGVHISLPVTLGDPMRPLLWVSKSHVKLAEALQKIGHAVSPNTVRKLLRQLGYSRQVNRKANDGRQHADRDAQFEHINAHVLAFQADHQPVISVDTKKKELIGNYTNEGTE